MNHATPDTETNTPLEAPGTKAPSGASTRAEGPPDSGGSGACPPRGSDGRRARTARLLVFLFGLLVVIAARPATYHARAAKLLVSFSDSSRTPEVVERMLELDVPASARGAARKVKARRFEPPDATFDTPAVVLVHGVQYRGIEEPRLLRFARSIASAGIVVVTPQIDELADYHVSPRSIETVGAAVRQTRARDADGSPGKGPRTVGLMGTSFGGGLALLTAADPRFADAVSFVLAIGAHDDLARVSRFFATDEIVESSGATKKLHAHEYGATVLVYTHVEDFFPEADVPTARDALRLWLWEDRDSAREAAKRLSPASKERVEKLFAADIASVRPELLSEIDRVVPAMKAVSPHGQLEGLKANVYLLHGEGDTVIPASETMWLASDVPPRSLCAVLVSPAILHVELKEPSFADKWALVHFMGKVIGEAEAR